MKEPVEPVQQALAVQMVSGDRGRMQLGANEGDEMLFLLHRYFNNLTEPSIRRNLISKQKKRFCRGSRSWRVELRCRQQ
jgi:hypothetical protein